jgi:hypothetical protein
MGAPIEHDCKPDALNRRLPAVDAALTIGSRRYALEHTRLADYSDEFEANAEWTHRFEIKLQGLERRECGRLGNDSEYELWMPARASLPVKNQDALVTAIENWIGKTAPHLREPFPNNVRSTTLAVRNSRVRVRLARYPKGSTAHRSTLPFHIERVPDYSERDERQRTIAAAFERKASKLRDARADGCYAVLVLEWTSSVATPYLPLFSAGFVLQQSYRDSIDRVVVVSTSEPTWSVQFIEVDQRVGNGVLWTNWWLYDPKASRAWKRPWV